MPAQILESPPSLPTARMKSARVGNRVSEDLGPARRERRVVRGVGREVRHREERDDRGVEHVRPEVPVGEFPVLARDESVIHCRREERVHACGAGRIPVQPVLEHELVGVPVGPGVEAFRALPVVGLVVAHERARVVLDCRDLRERLGRAAIRRRRGPELARRGEEDRRPARGRDVGRVGPDPLARTGRHGSRPDGVRTVGLRLCDDLLGDFPAEIEPRRVVARVLEPCEHAGPAGLLGHRLEGLRLRREEIRENRRRGLRRRGVLGRIRRAVRNRQGRGQAAPGLARSPAVVDVLRFPRRDRRVVHRLRHVRVNAVRIRGGRRSGEEARVNQVDPAVGRRSGVPERDFLEGLIVDLAHEARERIELCFRVREPWRRRRAVVLAGGDDPRAPGAGRRLDLGGVATSVRPDLRREGRDHEN